MKDEQKYLALAEAHTIPPPTLFLNQDQCQSLLPSTSLQTFPTGSQYLPETPNVDLCFVHDHSSPPSEYSIDSFESLNTNLDWGAAFYNSNESNNTHWNPTAGTGNEQYPNMQSDLLDYQMNFPNPSYSVEISNPEYFGSSQVVSERVNHRATQQTDLPTGAPTWWHPYAADMSMTDPISSEAFQSSDDQIHLNFPPVRVIPPPISLPTFYY
ncbi:hypothetical protein VKT23_015104 [Stygiomarasmius scandens]|uniref:Uncharacterized protein n=1 Tax=Marasmiellus scandens TaxID=2682957 RepID=A0ABR1J1F7_9AGAR